MVLPDRTSSPPNNQAGQARQSVSRDQWHCNGCEKGTDEVDIEERYSLGLYAGRWCGPCWNLSRYRDGPSGFDPLDAGEYYEQDY